MENRRHERYPADLDATLTDTACPDRTTAGRIINISQSGVCAEMSREFPVGATVKLQLADCELFGYVIHCRREGGAHEIGIEVVHVLIGESDLAQLVNAILAETMPNTPGVTAGRDGAD